MKTSIQKLSIDKLIIDPAMQRKVVDANLAEIRAKFNEVVLGQLVVSHRANGSYVILDGQHRWLATQLEAPHLELQCLVFEDLTSAQEAELFLSYNTQSAVNATKRFEMAVVAGHPAAKAIQAVLDNLGLSLGSGTNQIAAASDLVKVATWPKGLELLDWSLDVLTTAWSGEREDYNPQFALERRHGNRPYRGDIIRGMALIRHRYGSLVKPNKMVAALIALGARGPEELYARARTLQTSMGRIPTDSAVARVLIEIYNDLKKHGPNVEPWEFSRKDDAMSRVPGTIGVLLDLAQTMAERKAAEESETTK